MRRGERARITRQIAPTETRGDARFLASGTFPETPAYAPRGRTANLVAQSPYRSLGRRAFPISAWNLQYSRADAAERHAD